MLASSPRACGACTMHVLSRMSEWGRARQGSALASSALAGPPSCEQGQRE